MTPIESKNSSNINRVRCFAQDGLVEDIASKKYDLIQVVCTQPFNKHVQYGLSFIKIHVADDNEAVNSVTLKQNFIAQTHNDLSANSQHIGDFTLRDDSPDSESESSAGLFTRWKTSHTSDRTPTGI